MHEVQVVYDPDDDAWNIELMTGQTIRMSGEEHSIVPTPHLKMLKAYYQWREPERLMAENSIFFRAARWLHRKTGL